MDQITPEYYPVPTTPGNGTHDPFNDNSILMSDGGATSRYGLGIQNKNLYGPPVTLAYDRGSSSYGSPSTLVTNQLAPLVPRAQEIHHNPQEHPSSLSMATDRPPMYYRNPILDESAPVPSSSNANTNEKRGRSSRITQNTLFKGEAKPDVELTSVAGPRRGEENINVWNSGYPQPLKFVPIV